MSAPPRVSVFIPVHNREHYIAVAVNSILVQSFEDFELIVVDDGSTDRTVEVLERFDDPRLRIERNPTNLGIPATRNRGLELARGEYIALLDSDDHSYPQRLARQAEWLDDHPDVVQLGSWCSFMDAAGAMLETIRRQPLESDEIHAHLLFHCPVINRTVMARTAALRKLGYSTDFPRCQDYEMHCRLIEHGARLANLPDILVCGREHPGRFTGQTSNLGRHRKLAIQKRMLGHLDIDHDDQDLAWHYALTRKSERPDDTVVWLDWVEAWLWRIKQANRASGFYPEPA
ncbi:MAG: glycosyltransferase family 2 protein, partial [Wenzhouxiangellaceae bacterium]